MARRVGHARETILAGDFGTGAAPSVKVTPVPQAPAVAKPEPPVIAPAVMAKPSDAQPPFWPSEVPGIGRPLWQVGLFALGAIAVTVGIVSLSGKRR